MATFELDIARLVDQGFERGAALAALRAAHGDVAAAADALAEASEPYFPPVDFVAESERIAALVAARAAADAPPPPPRAASARAGAFEEAVAALDAPANVPPPAWAPPATFSLFIMPLLHLLTDWDAAPVTAPSATPLDENDGPAAAHARHEALAQRTRADAAALRAELERRPQCYGPVLAVVECARRVAGFRLALREELAAAPDHVPEWVQTAFLTIAGEAEARALSDWLVAEYARGGGHAYGLVPR